MKLEFAGDIAFSPHLPNPYKGPWYDFIRTPVEHQYGSPCQLASTDHVQFFKDLLPVEAWNRGICHIVVSQLLEESETVLIQVIYANSINSEGVPGPCSQVKEGAFV